MEETNIFKDPDWVLGDLGWIVLGGTVVIEASNVECVFSANS